MFKKNKMNILGFVRNLCGVIFIHFLCARWVESCTCGNATREEKFCDSDYTVIGRLIGRFVTPGVQNNIFVIQVQFHIKGSGPKYIELESPMSISKCGTVLDVGQDYILAGKIKSGIRGELSVCSWQEKWSDCPFLVRWRLLQKQITCRSQRVHSQPNHISLTQNENTVYSNQQQNHVSAPEHHIPPPEQTPNHVSAPENQVPPPENQITPPEHQIQPPEHHITPAEHLIKALKHQIPPPEQTSNQMFQISHPKNYIYPSRSHRQQPQSYMDRMIMENHLGMSDLQEQMDYIGGRGRLYGYGISGGSDMYSHFRESMD